MFSYFRKTPLSRFEKCNEFAQIATLINELRDKKTELMHSAVKNGVTSIDYLKHIVILKLVSDIDDRIAHFNENFPQHGRDNEAKDKLKFTDELLDMIIQTLNDSRTILLTPRNNQRKMVNYTLHCATVVGAVGAAIAAAPMPFLVVPTVFLGSTLASNQARSATGLSNVAPRTACIMFELAANLIVINVNLCYSLKLGIEKYKFIYSQLIEMGEDAESNEHKHHPFIATDRNTPSYQENAHEENRNETGNSASGLLHIYSEATQDYINTFVNKVKPSLIIEQLKLNEQEETIINEYLDPITTAIMDLPILLNERSVDLNTILNLPVDESGMRKDPFNNYKFYLRDLQPDRNTANKIQEAIEKINLARAEQAPENIVNQTIEFRP